MNVNALSRDQILAIDQPERLFETAEQVAARFKELVKVWHPDVPGTGDGEVFGHIAALHKTAATKIATGEWHTPGLLQIVGTDGVTRKIRYLKDFDCGLGMAYISKKYVTYVISDDYADLFHDATQTLGRLKFPNDKEREQVSPCLPAIKTSFATNDSLVLVVSKPEDTIRLRDLLEHVGGKIDPKHVAWIVNRLLMLVNFLKFNKITHGDISLDSVFISPGEHRAVLIGGWWYTTALGSRMARVQPARTLVYAPHSILQSKIADVKVDLELARLVGREILGDETGVKLSTDKNIPSAMVEWLRSATSGDAIADYARWPEVLKTVFGQRRFVPWTINISDIYKEIP
jgi:serine/threonine protein kinase